MSEPLGVHLNLHWRDPLDTALVKFADACDALIKNDGMTQEAFVAAWQEHVESRLRPLLKELDTLRQSPTWAWRRHRVPVQPFCGECDHYHAPNVPHYVCELCGDIRHRDKVSDD